MRRASGVAGVLVVLAATLTASGATDLTGVAAHGVPGSSDGPDPYYPTDGNGGLDVTDYHVAISYNPPSRHLDGDTTVTARATQDLARFDLDLSGLTVRSVLVNGVAARFRRDGAHELVITPAGVLRQGSTFAVRVRYDGTPKAIDDPSLGVNGWQVSSSGGAFVAGEPHSAASWYPSNDTPSDKATFAVSATVPDGWSVIANGREQPVTPARPGWRTYSWADRTPIATYLTTIGIDHWTLRTDTLPDGTPVVSAYAPGAQGREGVGDRVPEVLAFLASKFGPYPQDAAGGIYLNENINFSLETQTRPTYAQWTDLSTVVHENAHQWFGDSVSVRDWRDVCLNECFASYAQWLWSEAKEGDDLDARYRRDIQKYRADQDFWAGKLYDMGPGKEFTAVYSKGALAMHALRRQVGERAFDTVLRGWPAAHRDSNASWPEFESYVESVSGQNLSGFFDAWFHAGTIPADRYLWPGPLRP